MAELILIIGPCGAGKTTYARMHYPYHLHVDYERLIQSFFATSDRFRFYPHVRKTGKMLYETAIHAFIEQRRDLCVPDCGATRRQRAFFVSLATAQRMPLHCIRLLVDQDVAIARAKADKLRPVSSRSCWQEIVAHWFRDFEPVDAASEGFASYQEIDNA